MLSTSGTFNLDKSASSSPPNQNLKIPEGESSGEDEWVPLDEENKFSDFKK
jgi:hypothetical protein